jgi:DNA-binding transcriptional ArsR family regulator
VPTDVDRTFAALADGNRRAIVRLLMRQPRRPSEVADALAISRPALSRHLRVLRTAGLIEEQAVDTDARARLLQLRPEPLAQLRSWLEEVEDFWTGQLDALKAHAERPRPRRRR